MASRNKALLVAAASMVVVVVGALLPATTSAKDFKVGDDKGWTRGVDYSRWALNKGLFVVGDTLEFVYRKGSHNVVLVTKGDYDACTVPSNAQTFNSGHDRLTLGALGLFYFICGVRDHCQSGMKMEIIAV